MRFRSTLTALLTLAALLAAPALAAASSDQVALFQEDRLLLQRGDGARNQALDEIRGLGVDMVKIPVSWWQIAPATRRKPAGFDGGDPADYDQSRWATIDAAVREAQARGLGVMLALVGPAPGWATRGDSRDRVGVNRPSDVEFARFAEVVARRYPSVHDWTLWNEPNHPGFLYPQATRQRVPYAPYLYRNLVAGAVRGLAAGGHGGDRILFGELLPIGKARLFRKNTMKPLLFLREMFCVNRAWHRYRGAAARRRGCSGFRAIGGVSGFAYHPYTRPGGPRAPGGGRDDATIRALGKVARTLDRAQRAGRLGGPSGMGIWNTEFGFQSNPPDRFQTPIARIPGFLNESEWISFRNPRVASYSQYTLQDDPLGGSNDVFGTWQGGLRFADGRVKAGPYAAYRLPIFVRLLGPSAVEVWGDARPGGAGSIVQVQARSGGRWSNLGGPATIANPRGYFRVRYRIAKAGKRAYRFTFLGFTSRATKAVVR